MTRGQATELNAYLLGGEDVPGPLLIPALLAELDRYTLEDLIVRLKARQSGGQALALGDGLSSVEELLLGCWHTQLPMRPALTAVLGNCPDLLCSALLEDAATALAQSGGRSVQQAGQAALTLSRKGTHATHLETIATGLIPERPPELSLLALLTLHPELPPQLRRELERSEPLKREVSLYRVMRRRWPKLPFPPQQTAPH